MALMKRVWTCWDWFRSECFGHMPVSFTHPQSYVKAMCICLAVEPLRGLQALAWVSLVPLVAAGREGGAVRAERRAEASAGELGRVGGGGTPQKAICPRECWRQTSPLGSLEQTLTVEGELAVSG